MKRSGFLSLSVVIMFVMLANNVLLTNASNSSSLLAAATRTPTPTKKATATKTPKPTKKTKIPASVLTQTYYYSFGTPGGDSQTPCENSNVPIVLSGLADVKQLDSLELTTCAWNLDKDVIAIVVKSDGTTETETLQIYPYSDSGIIELRYTPTAFDPIGNYKIHFSNGKQALDVEFNVSLITEPGAVIIPEDHEVQVYNFYPYEKIFVFQYNRSIEHSWPFDTHEWKLQAWQILKVENDGKLRINITDTGRSYVVIGEETGEYNTDRGDVRIKSILNPETPIIGSESSCPGTPTRMEIGSIARVTTPTRIREQPSISARINFVLPRWTLFLITNGAQCSDGYTWWYGITNNGIEGWMAESQKGTYLLESVP